MTVGKNSRRIRGTNLIKLEALDKYDKRRLMEKGKENGGEENKEWDKKVIYPLGKT